MAFDTHNEDGEYVQFLGLDCPYGVVDIFLFLEQVFAEKDQADITFVFGFFIAFFIPFAVMIQILEVIGCFRMIETHCRDFNHLVGLDRYVKVFRHDVIKHAGKVFSGRVHPVGIYLHPVFEILGLFGDQRQHRAHDLEQFHIAVKRVFITSLNQHFRHLFHDVRHAAAVP